MTNVELLKGQWENLLIEEVRRVQNEVVASSPYVTSHGVDALSPQNIEYGRQDIEILFLTNLSPLNQISGATDPHALKKLFEK